MTRALVVLAVGGVLAAGAGCPARPRCDGPSRLEARRGDGALELRLVDAPAGSRPGQLDLCDPAGQRVGGLLWEGADLVLVDRGGGERLRAPAGAAQVTGPDGQALRLFRAEGSLRVLKPDGVPHGTLTEAGPGLVTISDPGGSPLARATPRDADAIVAGADGVTRAYLVPNPGLLAAAVYALEALPAEERAFLLVHLSRARFGPK